MSLNIADLFVSLGIKGSEKTLGALKETKKNFTEVGTSALEMKVAAVAAFYSIEQFMSAAGTNATRLTNLSLLIDTATDSIQRYDYATRQAGIANGVFEATLPAIQQGMLNTQIGHGTPEGLAWLAKTIQLDQSFIDRAKKDPTTLIDALQKMYNDPKMDLALKNKIATSFQAGGLAPAFLRNEYNSKTLGAAPILSKSEIAANDAQRAAWGNLENRVEIKMSKFIAKDGKSIIGSVEALANAFLHLADAMSNLDSRFHILKKFSVMVDILAANIQGGTFTQGGREALRQIAKEQGWNLTGLDEPMKDVSVTPELKQMMEANALHHLSRTHGVQNNYSSNQTNNITHVGDAEDTQGVKDTWSLASKIDERVRQSPALTRAT